MKILNEFAKIDELCKYPKLVHGYSTKYAGNMSTKSDCLDNVLKRRQAFASYLEIDLHQAFYLPLTHSNNVLLADDFQELIFDQNKRYLSGGRIIADYKNLSPVYFNEAWQTGIDAVILKEKDVFPVMLTGDCAAVGIFDVKNEITAFIHLGMIGCVNHLLIKVLQILSQHYSSVAGDLVAIIYPSIRSCHYNLASSGVWKIIGPNVTKYYGSNNPFFQNNCFNIQSFIENQLYEFGVLKENIYDSGLCTVCNNLYFYSNYLANSPELKLKEGRFASIFGLRK